MMARSSALGMRGSADRGLVKCHCCTGFKIAKCISLGIFWRSTCDTVASAISPFRKSRAAGDSGSDHQDIVSKLFDVQREKSKDFSEDDVTSMAASNIMARSNTTAISLRAFIYHLLKNPEYKRQLLEEIDTQRKENKLSEIVTLEQSKGMPYLQAVMQEALRCHPCGGHESSWSNTRRRY